MNEDLSEACCNFVLCNDDKDNDYFPVSSFRAGRAAVPFSCGRQVMAGGVEITARVTATPTASTPSP